MKPADVADFLGIGRSTVSAWTAGEFAQYFTPGAQGGEGHQRVFTDQDVKIMYLLKQLKNSNTAAAQIHQHLQSLRARDWQGLPDLPDAREVGVVPVIPTAAADAALSSERRGLLREIQMLNERIDELKAERESREGEKERLLREIGSLSADLREAKTLLDLYEQGRLKPKE